MISILLLISCFLHSTAALCPVGSNQSLTDKTTCYYFANEKTNFMAADQHCVGLNGNLVSIHNMFENVFLGSEAATVFTDSANDDFWIGANNLLTPGTWSWMDGTTFDFTDWGVKQPINVSNTNCGAMITQAQRWIADNCIKNKPYVCLVKIFESTVPPATTTTAISSLCPETWTYFNVTNFCYKVIVNRTTWWDAEMQCVNVGSHLASLHSWEENRFVAELVSPHSTNECVWDAQTWVGMSTQDRNAHWNWTDGTAFDYSNWGEGEPNNPGVENCGQVWTGQPCHSDSGYVWAFAEMNNWPCTSTSANFVCKKNHL